MAFGDVRICLICKAVSIEDDQVWVDPQRCPRCGASLDEPRTQDPGPQPFKITVPQELPS